MTRGERRFKHELPLNHLSVRTEELKPFAYFRTISDALNGRGKTGAAAILKLELQDRLSEADWRTPGIYSFYQKLTDLGTDPRFRKLIADSRDKTYNSRGYTAKLAKTLNLSEQYLRKRLRALRAMAVYESIADTNAEFNSILFNSISQFYEVEKTHPKTMNRDFAEIMENWDGTIIHFYKLLDEKTRHAKLGTLRAKFLPYEIDMFKSLITYLIQKDNKPSAFTLGLIREIVNNGPIKNIALKISEETHIPVDQGVIDEYIYLLAGDFIKKAG